MSVAKALERGSVQFDAERAQLGEQFAVGEPLRIRAQHLARGLLAVGRIRGALSFHDSIHRDPRDHVLPVPGRALQWTTLGSVPSRKEPVQILHPFAGSIQQYAKELADPDRYRPEHCPQCQAHHPLIGHGFYRRTLVELDFDGSSAFAATCALL